MVAAWCHGYLLSLGHFGSHEQDWRAYTQEVAKVSMKDVVLLVIQHMVAVEVLQTPLIFLLEGMSEINNWCHGLFVEPWTLWYPHTRFWSIVSKSNKLQHEIM